MFSRRLQVQERLTKQVALAIAEVLKPQVSYKSACGDFSDHGVQDTDLFRASLL